MNTLDATASVRTTPPVHTSKQNHDWAWGDRRKSKTSELSSSREDRNRKGGGTHECHLVKKRLNQGRK